MGNENFRRALLLRLPLSYFFIVCSPTALLRSPSRLKTRQTEFKLFPVKRLNYQSKQGGRRCRCHVLIKRKKLSLQSTLSSTQSAKYLCRASTLEYTKTSQKANMLLTSNARPVFRATKNSAEFPLEAERFRILIFNFPPYPRDFGGTTADASACPFA